MSARTRKPTPLVISDEHNEVKIYTVRSRGGSLYQISYYRTGERVRRTFADLNEAKREARMQLAQLAGERIQARALSAVEIESYTVATRKLEPIGVPLHVCAELFVEAYQTLNGRSILDAARYYMRHYDPNRPRKSWNDLTSEFVESRQAIGTTEKHIMSVKWTFKHFMQAFARTGLDDLTAGDLDRWLESRARLTNRSRNTCRVILVSFGNFLKKRGYLPAERQTVFDQMCVWKDEIAPVSIYSCDDLRFLLGKADEILVPYLTIGAFAGLRSAEIVRLDWKNIRFDRGFIECEAEMTKTRRRRLVPISDNLRAWLEPLKQDSGRVVPYRDVATAVCYFGHKIGMVWKRNALRHSYISNRLALVPDTARVALECGNSPGVIFSHYRELVTPAHAQEWFSIMPEPDYPQCLLARRSKYRLKPKWGSRIASKPQTHNLSLVPDPAKLASETEDNAELGEAEIRRVLCG